MSDGEIIRAPNGLKKAKVGIGPAKLDEQLLRRAEKAVQNLEASYGEWVKDDLNETERALAALVAAGGKDADAVKALYQVVFDTKGQAGSFGYHLLTRVAGSLAEFLCDRTEVDAFALKVASAHVSAMRAVVRENLRDDGGETAVELVESLAALIAKAEAAGSVKKGTP